MTISLSTVLEGLTIEDQSNLCALLEIAERSDKEQILERIKWLYYSKNRAGSSATTKNAISKLRSKLTNHTHSAIDRNELYEIPTYDNLISGACRHLRAFEKDKTIEEQELFLSQAIIIAALQRMSPTERKVFFESQVDTIKMTREANIENDNLRGPLTTFALLGVAQTSGFAVYVASTTALGFLTHAVGITLPFAVYTGMTSTIAFVIGPVGWLAAGIWGAWKMTQPKWKKLIPALIYIISIRSREKLEIPAK